MSYNNSRFSQISSEDFRKAVESSEFMVDVLEKLGYQRTSGTMTKYIKERILKEGIDTSHFKGQRGNRGGGNTKLYELSEILVEDSHYTNRDRLKKRLLAEGLLENKCYECGVPPEWNGKPLSLHLDHKNGKHNDHRIENIHLLCPNCHSQTPTFSGRNRKRS